MLTIYRYVFLLGVRQNKVYTSQKGLSDAAEKQPKSITVLHQFFYCCLCSLVIRLT